MMTDRIYRLLLGALLTGFLYFDLSVGVYVLIGFAIVEGITNWRLPIILNRIFPRPPVADLEMTGENLAPVVAKQRFEFEAERAFRLVFAGFTTLGYVVLPELLWFLPWMIAFFMFGAGVSGICPSLWMLKVAGFSIEPESVAKNTSGT